VGELTLVRPVADLYKGTKFLNKLWGFEKTVKLIAAAWICTEAEILPFGPHSAKPM